ADVPLAVGEAGPRWASLTLRPASGASLGSPGALHGTLCDVTARKHAERELRDVTAIVTAERALYQAHESLRALVVASPLAIVMLDAQCDVTLWNPAAERLFGFAAD